MGACLSLTFFACPNFAHAPLVTDQYFMVDELIIVLQVTLKKLHPFSKLNVFNAIAEILIDIATVTKEWA